MGLRDGWHDLPSGGRVRVRNGIPTVITDRGHYNLAEDSLLVEAEGVTCTKLTWRSLDRSRRWGTKRLIYIFSGFDKRGWSFAKVLPAACEICGIEAGNRWSRVKDQDQRVWCCPSCSSGSSAQQISENSQPIHAGCNASDGSIPMKDGERMKG